MARKGMRVHPPSPADEADAQALDAAVESMIERVLSGMDHNRPLGSLNRGDLRKLADAALTGWILKRAELAACGNSQIENELISDVAFVG